MAGTPATPAFRRAFGVTLASRLVEPRRFLQVVAGPRQVGKTTLVRQVLDELALPSRIVSADEPTLRDRSWLTAQWEAARLLARDAPDRGAVLALDEVHVAAPASRIARQRRGSRPTRAPSTIEWAAEHQDELLLDWELASTRQALRKIEPLR